MELIINKKVISAPVKDILEAVHTECKGRYLHKIIPKGDNVFITCAYHNDGNESHPSCTVYDREDNPDVCKGTVHCFACGISVPLYALVGHCFGEDDEFGKEWLVERFGDIFVQRQEILPEIKLTKDKEEYLDPSILNQYAYFHPYQFKRKLTEEVIKKYCIGYDKETDSITFPVWDEHNRLKFITERSVTTKRFYIPEGVTKPVYLLNFALQDGATTVYVAESQINTAYLNSIGYTAVGLIGTGTSNQYKILNKTPIRHYILALDGDSAGDKGIKRFIKNIRKDVLVDVMIVPRNKDVNDLSKEEIERLPIVSQFDINKYLK